MAGDVKPLAANLTLEVLGTVSYGEPALHLRRHRRLPDAAAPGVAGSPASRRPTAAVRRLAVAPSQAGSVAEWLVASVEPDQVRNSGHLLQAGPPAFPRCSAAGSNRTVDGT